MNENVLATLQSESPESEKKGDDTSSESPAETNDSEDGTASPAGGETPEKGDEEPAVFHAFHEHPRFLALTKALKEQEATIEELKKFKESVLENIDGEEKKSDEVPEWFSDVFGDDVNVWKKFKDYDSKREEEIYQRVAGQFEADKKKANEYNSWLDSEMNKMEEEGKKFDRNELLKVAHDYFPTNPDGTINLARAYEIMSLSKNKSSDDSLSEKKKIADKTIDKPKSGDVKTFRTPSDFDYGFSLK